MWVPFNEGWGQHDTPRIAKLVKDYDPTRLVNEASGWDDTGAATSRHAQLSGPGDAAAEKARVAVLGEFGGLGMPSRAHLAGGKELGLSLRTRRQELTDAYACALRRCVR